MGRVFFIADTHFGHDKDFIYTRRGYKSAEAMSKGIVKKWNKVVGKNDEVYLLGDVFLGSDENLYYLSQCNGNIHIMMGNHDNEWRTALMWELANVDEISTAESFEYKGQKIYISHYPTDTSNFDEGLPLNKRIINIHGHTHSTEMFNKDRMHQVCVSCDALDCRPIEIDELLDKLYKFESESKKADLV